VKRRTITELVGWYGFAAILAAYAATNLGWLSVSSGSYRALNLTGALALIIDSWPDRNWQVIALNGVWAAIAIIALIRL
jgi:hypothetical protein